MAVAKKKGKKSSVVKPDLSTLVRTTLPVEFLVDVPLVQVLLNEQLVDVTQAPNSTVLNDVLGALSPEVVEQVALWARNVVWVQSHPEEWNGVPILAVATVDALTVPPEFASIAHHEVRTVATIREFVAAEHIIDNDSDSAITTENVVESAAVEPAETEADAGEIELVEADGQHAMFEDEALPVKDVVLELAFTSRDEALSTARALQARAADLKDLAKKNRAMGKVREAESCEGEARRINEALLSQLQPQMSIPFNDDENTLDRATRIVGHTVRAAVVRALTTNVTRRDGETTEDAIARRKEQIADFEELIGAMAAHTAAAVLPMLSETSERAKEAGLAERHATPDELVREALWHIEVSQGIAA